MPDDDMTGIVDHHGHDEAEFPDAVRDLVDLALRMLPWIASVQDEIIHIAIFNLDFDQAGVSCRSAASFRSGACRSFRCMCHEENPCGVVLRAVFPRG